MQLYSSGGLFLFLSLIREQFVDVDQIIYYKSRHESFCGLPCFPAFLDLYDIRVVYFCIFLSFLSLLNLNVCIAVCVCMHVCMCFFLIFFSTYGYKRNGVINTNQLLRKPWQVYLDVEKYIIFCEHKIFILMTGTIRAAYYIETGY